jgi:hypothetical protein
VVSRLVARLAVVVLAVATLAWSAAVMRQVRK